MTGNEVHVQLFEYGGGMVLGTADIADARERMQRRIREEWDGNGPFPWQTYDFSGDEPAVERGIVMEDPDDPAYARWVHSDFGTLAVVWR